MNFNLNIIPNKSGAFREIAPKMSNASHTSAPVRYIMSAQDFKYRKSGSSLAFSIYKMPDFVSKNILKLCKAFISDEKQRVIYSNGFYETLRFLKTETKNVK